jgi:ketosteroid isomerase-like protein
MSHDHVKIAKRAIDAFNRRDLDGFSEVATADFEFVPALLAMVEGGSIRGREGLEEFFESIPNTWDEFRTLAEDFRDLGDQVLALGRAEARGRGSGVELDAPMGLLLDFRAERISRARAYLDHGEALRAAGLTE